MKKFSKISIFGLLVIFIFFSFRFVNAATTPSLGMASSYGLLSSTYTNTSATTINGDVGFTISPAVAPLGIHPNYWVGAPYPQAGLDQNTALVALSDPAQPCTFTFAAGAVDISTDATHGTIWIYEPGVYCSLGAMTVGSSINLSGAWTFIFRSFPAALNTTVDSVISLTNGASACDVFWISTNTTLAATTTFVGTVIDNSFITVGANTTWLWRALSFGWTVTTDTDTITVPNCAPATLHIIKQVINDNWGLATANLFNLYVRRLGINVAGSPAPGAILPGTSYTLSPGTYVVSEDVNPNYAQSFGWDCDVWWSIVLAPGDNKTCTVINNDIAIPSGGGGWWWWVILLKDVCPNWDESPSYYDWICVLSPVIVDSWAIVPLIGITKVPNPLSLPEWSGYVVYNYTVWNVWNEIPLVDITVKDDKCSAMKFISWDTNNNNKIDINEKWKYTCTTKLLETTTNTVIAKWYSDDIYRQVTVDTAIATVVVWDELPPLINIVKIPSRLTPFPFWGGDVEYIYIVTNPGIVPISDVVVVDNKCSGVSLIFGDENNNKLLDVDETWTYSCSMNISVSTRNIATVRGIANGLVAIDYAFADVLVFVPWFPKTWTPIDYARRNMLIVFCIILVSTGFMLIYKRRNIQLNNLSKK